MKAAFDAAYPPPTVPQAATTACIYMGGDTPNAIADPESVPVYGLVRYWLPIWVRSNPAPALASPDAVAALAWLARNGAPGTCSVVLDLETAVTASYVAVFANLLAPHPILPYGSRSSLASNPPAGGRFLAWPGWTGTTWPVDVVAIQHTYAGTYDLSAVQTSVALWDRHSPPVPSPSNPPSDQVVTVLVRTGPDGCGWNIATAPWQSFLAATLQAGYPPVDGYWAGSVSAADRTGEILVVVTGAAPKSLRRVFVAVRSA